MAAGPECPPPDWLCPISQEVMLDPVLLIETGILYDRLHIEQWFAQGKRTCPCTGKALSSTQLAPVFTLKSSIHEWLAKHPDQAPPAPAARPTDSAPKQHQTASAGLQGACSSSSNSNTRSPPGCSSTRQTSTAQPSSNLRAHNPATTQAYNLTTTQSYNAATSQSYDSPNLLLTTEPTLAYLMSDITLDVPAGYGATMTDTWNLSPHVPSLSDNLLLHDSELSMSDLLLNERIQGLDDTEFRLEAEGSDTLVLAEGTEMNAPRENTATARFTGNVEPTLADLTTAVKLLVNKGVRPEMQTADRLQVSGYDVIPALGGDTLIIAGGDTLQAAGGDSLAYTLADMLTQNTLRTSFEEAATTATQRPSQPSSSQSRQEQPAPNLNSNQPRVTIIVPPAVDPRQGSVSGRTKSANMFSFSGLLGHSPPGSQSSSERSPLLQTSSAPTGSYTQVEGEMVMKLKGHTLSVCCVQISPDQSLLATGSWDKTARLWCAITGRPLAVLTGHSGYVNAVAFVPGNTGPRIIKQQGSMHAGQVTVATGGSDGAIRLWKLDPAMWQLPAATGPGSRTDTVPAPVLLQGDDGYGPELGTHNDEVHALVCVPASVCSQSLTNATARGSYLVSASGDATICIWDTQSRAKLAVLKGHASDVRSLAVCPAQPHLLLSGSHDWTVKIWDLRVLECVQTFQGHTSMVVSIAVTSDGAFVASAGLDDDRPTCRVWEVASGRETHRFESLNAKIRCVEFLPNGRLLLLGMADGWVHVYDAVSGDQLGGMHLGEKYGIDRSVCSLAVGRDGGVVVTGSAEGRARVWQLACT